MKKFAITAAALLALGAFAPVMADDHEPETGECGATIESQGGEEVAFVEATGTTVYSTDDGVGVTGSNGWIEIGQSGAEGSTPDGGVNGAADAEGNVCLHPVTTAAE